MVVLGLRGRAWQEEFPSDDVAFWKVRCMRREQERDAASGLWAFPEMVFEER